MLITNVASIIGGVLLMAAVAVAGRSGRTTGRGVLLGIAVGLVGSFVLFAVGGAARYLLPVGQMEFYLYQLLVRLGLAG
ncbi:MAG: hypothetical protein R3D44_14260 [Hyphomicrobiaceae bacterium]